MVSPFWIITWVNGQIKANEIISTKNWHLLYSHSDMKEWQYKFSKVMDINNTQIQSKLMYTPPWLNLWPRCYSGFTYHLGHCTLESEGNYNSLVDMFVADLLLSSFLFSAEYGVKDIHTGIQIKQPLSCGAFKTDTSTTISSWIVSRKILLSAVLNRVFVEGPWSSIILD